MKIFHALIFTLIACCAGLALQRHCALQASCLNSTILHETAVLAVPV